MKHTNLGMWGIAWAAVLLVSGCSKNNNPADAGVSLPADDQQAIQQIVAADALFTNDATYLNDGSAPLAKDATAILPRAWGRNIDPNSVTRTVTYQTVDDTTVIATVTTSYSGSIWIRAKYTQADTGVSTITKPFSETTTRKVKFARVARTNKPSLNWKVREVSAVMGGTQNAQVSIKQVRFFVGDDTLTITDPNNYWLRLGYPGGRLVPELTTSFAKGFKVEVTVTSASPDSDIVSAHRPFWFMGRWQYRAPMRLVSEVNNGDGTFTRVYDHSWAGVWAGRHHMFVSALTRESIFDDTAQFSSQVWGVPFIVQ